MKRYAVLGMGRFGQSLAVELVKMGHEVLAVDKTQERLIEVEDKVTHCVVADVADEDAVGQLGIEDVDTLIISIGNDIQSSVLCAIICKGLGVNKIWAKASSSLHAKILKKIGVDRIILPEHEMGVRVAHHISNSQIVDYIALSNEHQLVEISVKDEWVGNTIGEINFRTKYGINIIGVRHDEGFVVTPGPNHKIEKGDVLSIIGKNSDIDRI